MPGSRSTMPRRTSCGSATTARPPAGRRSPGRRPSTRRCASAGSTGCAIASTKSATLSASRPPQGKHLECREHEARPGADRRGTHAPGRTEGVRSTVRERTAIYSYERATAAFSDDQQRRFEADRAAWAFWQAQPPSYRRAITHWVSSAKREETRERRFLTARGSRAGGGPASSPEPLRPTRAGGGRTSIGTVPAASPWPSGRKQQPAVARAPCRSPCGTSAPPAPERATRGSPGRAPRARPSSRHSARTRACARAGRRRGALRRRSVRSATAAACCHALRASRRPSRGVVRHACLVPPEDAPGLVERRHPRPVPPKSGWWRRAKSR